MQSSLVMYGLVWPYAAMHNICACYILGDKSKKKKKFAKKKCSKAKCVDKKLSLFLGTSSFLGSYFSLRFHFKQPSFVIQKATTPKMG